MRRAHFLQIAFLLLASASLAETIAQQIKPQEMMDARAFRDRGLEQYGAGRFKDAIEMFARAIELKPDYAEAYNDFGMAYSKMNRHTEAVESLRASIHLSEGLATKLYGGIYQGVVLSLSDR